MAAPLKIAFAAAEAAPLAKTGGLADVAGALPRCLARLGHDVRPFMPLYADVDTRRGAFHRVDFLSDVSLALGARTYTFSAFTTQLPGSSTWIYLIDCPELYHRPGLYTPDADEPQRFAFFTCAVIECCQRMGWAPDVFHVHDWHAALLPLLLRTVYGWDTLFRDSRCLLTIHNIGYQGQFPAAAIDSLGLRAYADRLDGEDLAAGRFNFLRTGLAHAEAISTVSPTYAQEIQTDAGGFGLAPLLRARRGVLHGILNGVDYDVWSPERDPLIPHRFSRSDLGGKLRNKVFVETQMGLTADERAPLAGIVSRLTQQKGFDLCFDVLPEALARTRLRLVVLGSGEARYEAFFDRLQRSFPRQVSFYRGYSDDLAHLIEAGADLFLMPSRYEPCGLNQMYSLRYGTIPVVRRTGGLADSVRPFDPATGAGTGVVFEQFDAQGLRWALATALALYDAPASWSRMIQNAMAEDFSWERQAGRYADLYRALTPAGA